MPSAESEENKEKSEKAKKREERKAISKDCHKVCTLLDESEIWNDEEKGVMTQAMILMQKEKKGGTKTTAYFDANIEVEQILRRKNMAKDGKSPFPGTGISQSFREKHLEQDKFVLFDLNNFQVPLGNVQLLYSIRQNEPYAVVKESLQPKGGLGLFSLRSFQKEAFIGLFWGLYKSADRTAVQQEQFGNAHFSLQMANGGLRCPSRKQKQMGFHFVNFQQREKATCQLQN